MQWRSKWCLQGRKAVVKGTTIELQQSVLLLGKFSTHKCKSLKTKSNFRHLKNIWEPLTTSLKLDNDMFMNILIFFIYLRSVKSYLFHYKYLFYYFCYSCKSLCSYSTLRKKIFIGMIWRRVMHVCIWQMTVTLQTLSSTTFC